MVRICSFFSKCFVYGSGVSLRFQTVQYFLHFKVKYKII